VDSLRNGERGSFFFVTVQKLPVVSSFWRGGHFLGAWVLQFEKKNGII
jgi:hypothetical protein